MKTLSQKVIARKIESRRIVTNLKKNYQLYLIIALPLIWLFIFRYYPMYGIQVAFKKFYASKGISGSPWVGFDYFIKFFNNPNFIILFRNTLSISVYMLLAGFPIPIILALALNTTLNVAFKKVVQFVTYMPHFISTVVMVGLIIQYMNPRTGIINMIIVALGGKTKDFMAFPDIFPSIYVWSGIWQSAGWGTIIYLATLAGIDPELHEAAMIDGANRFKRIIHIDLPGIIPTAIILLIMDSGRIMSVGFEKVFLMQNPLNLRTAEVISTYVYKIAFASQLADFSYSAAIGLFNSVINLILIVSVNYIAKRFNNTSIW